MTTPVKTEERNLSSPSLFASPTGFMFQETSIFRIIKSEESDECNGGPKNSSFNPISSINGTYSRSNPPNKASSTKSKLFNNDKTDQSVTLAVGEDFDTASHKKMNEKLHRNHVIASLSRASNSTTQQAAASCDNGINTVTKCHQDLLHPGQEPGQDEENESETEVLEMTEAELLSMDESMSSMSDAKEYVFESAGARTLKRKRNDSKKNKEKNTVVTPLKVNTSTRLPKEEPLLSPVNKRKPNRRMKTTPKPVTIDKNTKENSMGIEDFFKKVSKTSSTKSSKKKDPYVTDFTISKKSVNGTVQQQQQQQQQRGSQSLKSQGSHQRMNVKSGVDKSKSLVTLIEDSSSTESDSDATVEDDKDDQDDDDFLPKVPYLPGKCKRDNHYNDHQQPFSNSTLIEGRNGSGELFNDKDDYFTSTALPQSGDSSIKSSPSRRLSLKLFNRKQSRVNDNVGLDPIPPVTNPQRIETSPPAPSSTSNRTARKSCSKNKPSQKELRSTVTQLSENQQKRVSKANINIGGRDLERDTAKQRFYHSLTGSKLQHRPIANSDKGGPEEDRKLFQSSGNTVDQSLENDIDALVDLIPDEPDSNNNLAVLHDNSLASMNYETNHGSKAKNQRVTSIDNGNQNGGLSCGNAMNTRVRENNRIRASQQQTVSEITVVLDSDDDDEEDDVVGNVGDIFGDGDENDIVPPPPMCEDFTFNDSQIF